MFVSLAYVDRQIARDREEALAEREGGEGSNDDDGVDALPRERGVSGAMADVYDLQVRVVCALLLLWMFSTSQVVINFLSHQGCRFHDVRGYTLGIFVAWIWSVIAAAVAKISSSFLSCRKTCVDLRFFVCSFLSVFCFHHLLSHYKFFSPRKLVNISDVQRPSCQGDV